MEERQLQLQKEWNHKENEWKKDRAVFEQRINLLELQLQECKMREQNQKQLNDTIMIALNDVSKPQSKVFKDLLTQMENQYRDVSKNEIIKEYENKCRHIQLNCDELEHQLREQCFEHEKAVLGYQQQIEMHKRFISELEQKVRTLEQSLEERNEQQALEQESQNLQFKRSAEQLRGIIEQHQHQLNQLIQQHENEKEQLNQRINKCQNLIKKYQSHMESNRNIQDVESGYNQEISSLKKQLDQQELNHEFERKKLQQQLEDSEKLARSLELQVSLMRRKKSDDMRHSFAMKENNPNRFDSSHKKLSNPLMLSKIDTITSSPLAQIQNFNHDSPKHNKVSQFPSMALALNEGKALQLPDHIQNLRQAHFPTVRLKQDSERGDLGSLPMPFDDYTLLKKKRNGSSSSSVLGNNTLSLNENSIISTAHMKHSQLGAQQPDQWMQDQLTNRQTTEQAAQDFQRKFSQTSVNQLHKLLIPGINDYGLTKDRIIVETSQEQNKETEPGLSYIARENTRQRGFSQGIPKTQNSGKKALPHSEDREYFNLPHTVSKQTISNTCRMNDNHLNHMTKLKARYQHPDDEQLDMSGLQEQVNLANVSSKQSSDSQVNQEIKYLIGKLLKAKGKLTEGLMNNTQSANTIGKVLAHNTSGVQGNQSFYAQHRKALTNQSVQMLPKQQFGSQILTKPRHQKMKSATNFNEF